MIYGFDRSKQDAEIAALSAETRVRILNCGLAGCLLESTKALAVGTAATLRITFGGRDFEDIVRVVRCQPIAGTGAIYHVGTEFVTTTAAAIGSLRYLIRRENRDVIGWLHATGRP